MTKKNFEFMAKLVWIYSEPDTPNRWLLVDVMIHLGSMFNDKFDADRFEKFVNKLDKESSEYD